MLKSEVVKAWLFSAVALFLFGVALLVPGIVEAASTSGPLSDVYTSLTEWTQRRRVTVTELEREYYINNFVVAKRVLEKKYRWPSFPGLSPAARNRGWDFPVVTALPSPKPLPAIVPPMAMLVKIFWYWRYSSTFS
jgi:hypothetical protein